MVVEPVVVVKVVSDWETRAVRAEVVMAEPVREALLPLVMVAVAVPLPEALYPEALAASERTDEAPALCAVDAEPRASVGGC